MKYMMIAALLGGLFVVGAGCSKDEKTASSSAESTGVPECDDYVKKMDACLAKIPAAAKPAMEANFKSTRESFKTNGATAEGKAGLKATCKTLVDQLASNPACK